MKRAGSVSIHAFEHLGGLVAILFCLVNSATAGQKPTITLTFSPGSTVSAGTPVTITASVTTGCGFLRITNSAGGGNLASGPANSISTIFDTTGLGGTSIDFEARFDPGAPDQCAGTWAAAKSTKITLTIGTDACPFPGVVHVGASLGSGDGNPPSPFVGSWQFQIAVTNCTGSPLTNVKVQGGSNGWAPLAGAPGPSTGTVSVSSKNKAQVITWMLNLASGATETLTINVSGSIPSNQCGTTRYLSGAWSAVYTDPASLVSAKSDYSGRVSVDVCGL